MYVYSLTLQKPTGITHAVLGNFCGTKEQEIVVARGKVLEILRPDSAGKLQSIYSVEIFGVVRSLSQFRLTGGQKDFLVVGSDSGRIVIFEYNRAKNAFDKVHQETFGKSGCRRIVPGQYLAVDPKGRAVMVGAIEKQKFVYVLNRDSAARLTISSPLEAHKSSTLVYSLVGVDCGFDNPSFAAIELDYADVDADPSGTAAAEAQKQLTFYELDLGLNHVVRKWAAPVDNGAHLLVPVPGGADGPSGVLVCCENFVVYKNQGMGEGDEEEEIRALIPRRADLPADRGVLITAAATYRKKSVFFFLLQTEYGDVFKATLEYDKDDHVTELRLTYFDTIPVASALCITRSGLLFSASEAGDHSLYRFQGTGEDEEVVSSSAALEETEDGQGYRPVFFHPRRLRNLLRIDDSDNLMPLLDMKPVSSTSLLPATASDSSPHTMLLTACGRGPRSSLRLLRPGLTVSEMAVTQLPGTPTGVWTVKRAKSDEFDSYIVVSFANATLVLSIGGESVEEVSDSGFLDTAPSLQVALLGEDSLLQVHPGGIRHIRADGRIHEWKAPGKKAISKAASNGQQVVAALSGGELVYFEMDITGQLMEVEKRETVAGGDVACVDIAPVPAGRQRGRFLAVGSYDGTVRVLSLDPDDCMQVLAVQALSAPPSSLLLLQMEGSSEGEDGADRSPSLFLNAGLQNGVLMRTQVDLVTGQLSDSRSRFLGLRPPSLFSARLHGRSAMLALSSRPWLGYSYQGHFHLSPLSYSPLESASPFSSDQCPEGIVAVAEDSLRVFTLEKLGDVFSSTKLTLRYTPRRLVVHSKFKKVIVVESDQGAFNAEERDAGRKLAIEATGAEEEVEREKEERKARMREERGEEPEEGEAEDEEEETNPLPDEQYGYPRGGAEHKWASCIRVVGVASSPEEGSASQGGSLPALETTSLLELTDDEAIVSLCTVQFHGPSTTTGGADAPLSKEKFGPLIAVGTAKGLRWWPKKEATGGSFVHIYKLGGEDGKQLELVHKTAIDTPSAASSARGAGTGGCSAVPAAMVAFQGRLLVGAGNSLRIYELGKKKLLRKCENRQFPNAIATLHAVGDRVYVGDVQESFHYVKYRREENQLYVFADDITPRWLTSALQLDYDSMAGADKFGNFFIARLPQEVSEEIEDDPTGGKLRYESGRLNGASNKLEHVIQFHVGDTITSLAKASLIPGGSESILYSTIMGSVAAFLPFSSREDVDFFSHLEMHLRQEQPPLCGRDHMTYRSSYFTVKDVIDGDLCEQYSTLPGDLQQKIAEELDRTPGEILKKLEDIRNKII